jgi:hypothetical protein
LIPSSANAYELESTLNMIYTCYPQPYLHKQSFACLTVARLPLYCQLSLIATNTNTPISTFHSAYLMFRFRAYYRSVNYRSITIPVLANYFSKDINTLCFVHGFVPPYGTLNPSQPATDHDIMYTALERCTSPHHSLLYSRSGQTTTQHNNRWPSKEGHKHTLLMNLRTSPSNADITRESCCRNEQEPHRRVDVRTVVLLVAALS